LQLDLLAGFDFLTQSLLLVLPPKPAVAVAQTQPLRCAGSLRTISYREHEYLIFFPNRVRPLHIAELVEVFQRIAHADVVNGKCIRIEDGEEGLPRQMLK
jgi:hypothetical protein